MENCVWSGGGGGGAIFMRSELICYPNAQLHPLCLCWDLGVDFSRLFGSDWVIFQQATLTWVKLSVLLCVSTSRTH